MKARHPQRRFKPYLDLIPLLALGALVSAVAFSLKWPHPPFSAPALPTSAQEANSPWTELLGESSAPEFSPLMRSAILEGAKSPQNHVEDLTARLQKAHTPGRFEVSAEEGKAHWLRSDETPQARLTAALSVIALLPGESVWLQFQGRHTESTDLDVAMRVRFLAVTQDRLDGFGLALLKTQKQSLTLSKIAPTGAASWYSAHLQGHRSTLQLQLPADAPGILVLDAVRVDEKVAPPEPTPASASAGEPPSPALALTPSAMPPPSPPEVLVLEVPAPLSPARTQEWERLFRESTQGLETHAFSEVWPPSSSTPFVVKALDGGTFPHDDPSAVDNAVENPLRKWGPEEPQSRLTLTVGESSVGADIGLSARELHLEARHPTQAQTFIEKAAPWKGVRFTRIRLPLESTPHLAGDWDSAWGANDTPLWKWVLHGLIPALRTPEENRHVLDHWNSLWFPDLIRRFRKEGGRAIALLPLKPSGADGEPLSHPAWFAVEKDRWKDLGVKENEPVSLVSISRRFLETQLWAGTGQGLPENCSAHKELGGRVQPTTVQNPGSAWYVFPFGKSLHTRTDPVTFLGPYDAFPKARKLVMEHWAEKCTHFVNFQMQNFAHDESIDIQFSGLGKLEGCWSTKPLDQILPGDAASAPARLRASWTGALRMSCFFWGTPSGEKRRISFLRAGRPWTPDGLTAGQYLIPLPPNHKAWQEGSALTFDPQSFVSALGAELAPQIPDRGRESMHIWLDLLPGPGLRFGPFQKAHLEGADRENSLREAGIPLPPQRGIK